MAGMTRHINLDVEEKLFYKLTQEAKEIDIPRNRMIRDTLRKGSFFTIIQKNQLRTESKIDKILKKLSKK